MPTPGNQGPLSFSLFGGALFRSVREFVMALAIAGLLITNIASVTSSRVHDAIYSVLSGIAQLGGPALAQRLLAASPTVRQMRAVQAQTRELQARQQLQELSLKRLDADHRQLQARHADLGRQHQQAIEARRAQTARVQQLASSVRTRLARNVARNTEALPAKVLPAIGVSVSVGLMAWDIYDACQTMREMNSVLSEEGEPPEDSRAVCGVSAPSAAQVLASVRSGWRASMDRTRVEFASMQGKIPSPEIRMPTVDEVRQVVCPVAPLPGVCP